MIKKETGFTGIDSTIAIIAIMLFTGIIIALMYNARLESIKIKAKVASTIYLTETMENIGIMEYEQITEQNTKILPNIPEFFQETLQVEEINHQGNSSIKKVKAMISYTIGNKTYEETIERLKVKE